jgi:hypothetical protein
MNGRAVLVSQSSAGLDQLEGAAIAGCLAFSARSS